MSSQLVGLLAASTQSGADADSLKTGAWVAQNGTQYNFGDHLPPGLAAYGQAVTTQMADMQSKGASPEKIADAGRAFARGEGYDGVQPGTEFVKASVEFTAGELFGFGLGAILGKASSWFSIGAKAIDDSTAYTKWWDNVAQPKTLTDREARAWYLSKEAEIPSRIDAGLSLEDQAKQAFAMRNDLRSTARELMSNRDLADSLNKSDPN